MNVLSSFSKGAKNAIGLSFAPSGSPNCDRSCSFHPEKNGGCYAHRLEQFRPGLRTKLDRHAETGADVIAEVALAELRMRRSLGEGLTWLRISPFGPVPKASQATPEFIEQLRALFAYCQAHEIAVHFPVESTSKRRFYQPLVADLGVTVRQSVHSERGFLNHAGPAAFTAGVGVSGPHLKHRRLQVARTVAKARYAATQRKTVVCPYDAVSDVPKARCGLCRACANPTMDIVYLVH